MNEHFELFGPLIAFLAGQIIAAVLWAVKVSTRLSVLETTVVANKHLANGLDERVERIDQHGTRNMPLVSDRINAEHARLDLMGDKLDRVGMRLDSVVSRLEETHTKMEELYGRNEPFRRKP